VPLWGLGRDKPSRAPREEGRRSGLEVLHDLDLIRPLEIHGDLNRSRGRWTQLPQSELGVNKTPQPGAHPANPFRLMERMLDTDPSRDRLTVLEHGRFEGTVAKAVVTADVRAARVLLQWLRWKERMLDTDPSRERLTVLEHGPFEGTIAKAVVTADLRAARALPDRLQEARDLRWRE
jgi:hypothetical protein